MGSSEQGATRLPTPQRAGLASLRSAPSLQSPGWLSRAVSKCSLMDELGRLNSATIPSRSGGMTHLSSGLHTHVPAHLDTCQECRER